ncbi:hypothetical protein, partial [Chryseobacterium sp. SIMBA_029]
KQTKQIPVFKAKSKEKGNYSENHINLLSKVGIFLLIGLIILLPILGIFKLFELISSLFV